MHKDPKEYFVDKIEEDIREIEEELDELEQKLEDSGWEPKMDYEAELDNIRLRLKELKMEMDRFEVTSGTTWSEFKKSCEENLSQLSRDTQDFSDRLDEILVE